MPCDCLQTSFMMHSSANAAGSAPDNDTDSSVVPGRGDKQMERGGRQGEYGDVDDEDMERANTGTLPSRAPQPPFLTHVVVMCLTHPQLY